LDSPLSRAMHIPESMEVPEVGAKNPQSMVVGFMLVSLPGNQQKDVPEN